MVILTREQLEERLAALHQASLELVRDLSLEQVLQRIIHIAREQAGAQYAALGVVDESGELIEFIPVGMSPEEVRLTGNQPVGKGMLGALKRERKSIRIPDIPADPRSGGFPTNHPEMHSFLGVPILLGEQLLGLIYLTEKTDYFEFTELDQKVIETLAAYAAIAIAHARLYKDLRQRDQALTQSNEDLSLINHMAAAMASSLEIGEILEQTLDRLMDRLGVEAGEAFLRDENSDFLRLVSHKGPAAQAFWSMDNFRLGEGYIGTVAETGKPMVCMDLNEDLRFLRRAVVQAGYRCIACIPLTAHGSTLGVICLASRKDRHFTPRVMDLLLAIGTWAGLSIENARLHRQAQRLAVLEERERIGMDLHDGIIQSIYAVGLSLDYAQVALDDNPDLARAKIDQAIHGLNNAIRDIRSYILDLRPRQFTSEDLVSGLESLVLEFNANSQAEARLSVPDDGLVGLPTANASALFHICQEALANVAKHAHAREARVNLWRSDDRVLLEISDNGRGFDLGQMSVTIGHGLSNMHIRARKVGGDVEITSDPDKGTTVLAWVPNRA